MSNTLIMNSGAEVKSFEVFPDGSGATAVIEAHGLVWVFDLLGQEIRAHRIDNRSASRRARLISSSIATAQYKRLIADLSEDWKRMNIEMYAEI
jgi:hypothetical protein